MVLLFDVVIDLYQEVTDSSFIRNAFTSCNASYLLVKLKPKQHKNNFHWFNMYHTNINMLSTILTIYYHTYLKFEELNFCNIWKVNLWTHLYTNFLPVRTLSPISSSVIATDFPFSSSTFAMLGKQLDADSKRPPQQWWLSPLPQMLHPFGIQVNA